MKLFYTEDEAIRDKLIWEREQESFTHIYYLDRFEVDIKDMKIYSLCLRMHYLFIRIEIKRKDKLKVFYVLQPFEEEVVKMILKAYNEQ